jgi:hypothetical protein
VIEPARDHRVRRQILTAMRAVLSDDHNYEQGVHALHDLVNEVAQEDGAAGLCDLATGLALELAATLERIARDQGLAAVDLAEVWLSAESPERSPGRGDVGPSEQHRDFDDVGWADRSEAE